MAATPQQLEEAKRLLIDNSGAQVKRDRPDLEEAIDTILSADAARPSGPRRSTKRRVVPTG